MYFKAEVNENIALNENHYLLTFSPLKDTLKPEGGQFYMLGVSSTYDPLLKRPFSFFRQDQILYRLKGKGTLLMKGLKKGDILDMIGPLGNSYPLPSQNHTPLIVAGGIGIASLFPLIESLKKKAVVIYGARTKSHLLMLNELRAYAKELILCTDDGSLGKKATVVEMLSEFSKSNYLIYSCGPREMLEAISEIALKRKIKGYISLETPMACGVGACLGCAVKTKSGYKRVCKEGPIFRIEDLQW